MWRDIGDYFLKLSLLLLGAWIIYPLAQEKFHWQLGIIGIVLYLGLAYVGLRLVYKHYEKQEEKKEEEKYG